MFLKSLSALSGMILYPLTLCMHRIATIPVLMVMAIFTSIILTPMLIIQALRDALENSVIDRSKFLKTFIYSAAIIFAIIAIPIVIALAAAALAIIHLGVAIELLLSPFMGAVASWKRGAFKNTDMATEVSFFPWKYGNAQERFGLGLKESGYYFLFGWLIPGLQEARNQARITNTNNTETTATLLRRLDGQQVAPTFIPEHYVENLKRTPALTKDDAEIIIGINDDLLTNLLDRYIALERLNTDCCWMSLERPSKENTYLLVKQYQIQDQWLSVPNEVSVIDWTEFSRAVASKGLRLISGEDIDKPQNYKQGNQDFATRYICHPYYPDANGQGVCAEVSDIIDNIKARLLELKPVRPQITIKTAEPENFNPTP